MADNLIYLVEITAYDPSLPGPRVLRYCSGIGYVTKPTETPANTLYEPRVVQPCNFTRTAFSDSRILGGSSEGYGEIVLNNADQALCPIMNYGLDGRSCRVLVGQQSAAYPGGFTTFINGTMEQIEVGATKVTIRVRDNLMLLSIPVQQTLYLGNNVLPAGAEGLDDIGGQPKPLCYGRVYYCPGVCVNTALLIYQVHDGPVQAIDSAFDIGIKLNKRQTSSTTFVYDAPVDYATLGALAGATFTGTGSGTNLTISGVTGTVQAGDNLAGPAVPGGYVSKVGGIVKRILNQRGGIDPSLCDGSFAALDTSFPYECGIYVGPGGAQGAPILPASTLMHPIIASAIGAGNTVQSAVDAVMLSGGCYLVPTRTGTWSIGQLVAPTGSPVAVFTDVDLISIDSEATIDQTAGVPVFSVYLRYEHYPGVLAKTEPAASLPATTQADITSEWRTINQLDASVQTAHLLAARLYRDTCLTTRGDANTEALRVLNLHKVRRDFVKATVRLDETKAVIDLGSLIQLTTPRLGYNAGRLFTVVGISSDGRRNELTLDLWG